MPRVTYVKSARKDNPVCKAGEPYYWWKFRHGGKRYSLLRPRPSQLTQSPYLSSVRSLVERINDASFSDVADFEEFRDEIVNELVELRDQCQESLDNMPESLQDSPTGELLQERIDALDNAENEISGLDIEEIDEEEFDDEDDAQAELDDRISNAISEMEDPVSCCDL